MSRFEAANLIAETLWWGFWIGAPLVLLALAAWRRRPWRKKPGTLADRMAVVYGRVRRRMERDELAAMEAEGAELWHPDRARVRNLSDAGKG
jgi:hypothetical protein